MISPQTALCQYSSGIPGSHAQCRNYCAVFSHAGDIIARDLYVIKKQIGQDWPRLVFCGMLHILQKAGMGFLIVTTYQECIGTQKTEEQM